VPRRTPDKIKKPPGLRNIFSIDQILELLNDIPGIDREKAEMIQRHWHALVTSSDKSDLTRLDGTHEIAIKHYLDSAMPLAFMTLPSPLLDIGSGAGFPGLVLKILSPQTKVILGENRPKRVKFMRQVIADLKLSDIEVYDHRIGPGFKLEVKGVVTRALESARDTLYRVQSFLPAGGKVILLKGPKGTDEINEATSEMTDFQHQKTYSFNLKSTDNRRQIVVFERKNESLKMSPAHQPHITQITSRANEHFKSLVALTEAKGIKKAQQYLVSGEKLVNEILNSNLSSDLQYLITEPAHESNYAKQVMLAPQLFRELDVLGTRFPIGVMRLPELRTWVPEKKGGLTVLLPFQDPGNIGAAIRSAAAFGAERVVLLQEAASPFLPKAIRAAANAIFHIEIQKGPSLAELIDLPLEIFRLDLEGEAIDRVSFPSELILLPGVEGYGFKEKGKTRPVSISHADKIESLNAQSALSIALYEIRRQRQLA